MNHRRLILVSAFAVSLASSLLHADDISNNITANLNQTSLDALAKDLGSLMGAGTFHQGKALGFPLGFDVGAHGVRVGLDDEDGVLRDDGSSATAWFVQPEVGLPGKINLIGRYGEFQDAKMIGGGLRLGLISPPAALPLPPALSISALYTKMEHDFLDANTISANAVLSFDIPFVHPYLGVGYDHTELEPTSRAYVGAAASVSRDLDASADGFRGEAGVNISLIPFTYINLGVGLSNGEEMYHAGLGVKL